MTPRPAPDPVRHVPDAERRARLATRHALHPEHRAADPVATTRAMTVLHATEAATVHLAVAARTQDVGPDRIDRALYEERSLVKQIAMRRTLFVFPRDLLPAALGSASARVAAEQRRRTVRDVESEGLTPDGTAWLARARAAVLERLEDSPPLSARQLREELPELRGTVTVSAGKKYGGPVNVAPRVLTVLGAEGLVVRGPNAGPWQQPRPTWTLMSQWLGGDAEPATAEEGYAALVRAWLYSFGPGTEEDLQWWLGGTKTAVRSALAAVGAVPVSVDRGPDDAQATATGWLLPDDLEPVQPVEPWAALLPTLDPTTMGWRGRGFYLDPAHVPYLFDTNGNAGNTAWWDGRIVGTWVQDDDAVVHMVPAPGVRLSPEAQAALEDEAARLTAWLDGVRISNVYASRLMKGVRLP